eukprot:TRINITY_DN12726_c0_g1_i1.p1 TRINITY_DN12726_c0_g1~~TRINITY_DN12726_c0_g1_i1.p1  ORF type:complete len:673 (-),score=138.74 TRINITY_DN12726_c0_g1_i1:213-2231(-)
MSLYYIVRQKSDGDESLVITTESQKKWIPTTKISLLSRKLWEVTEFVEKKIFEKAFQLIEESDFSRQLQNSSDYCVGRAIAGLVSATIRNGGYPSTSQLMYHSWAKKGLGFFNEKNETPLHLACGFDDAKLVQLLITSGADINARSGICQTPLHIATFRNNYNVMGLLLESGAQLLAFDDQGSSPLHVAKSLRATQMILSTASNRSASAEKIRDADSDGDLQKLLNAQDKDGDTALHIHAFKKGDDEEVMAMLTFLLSQGADPNRKNKSGMTCLHASIKNYPLLRLLLKSGADPNIQDSQGNTPLHIAAQLDSSVISITFEVISTLLSYKADPNVKNNSKRTPLDLAKGSRTKKALAAAPVPAPKEEIIEKSIPLVSKEKRAQQGVLDATPATNESLDTEVARTKRRRVIQEDNEITPPKPKRLVKKQSDRTKESDDAAPTMDDEDKHDQTSELKDEKTNTASAQSDKKGQAINIFSACSDDETVRMKFPAHGHSEELSVELNKGLQSDDMKPKCGSLPHEVKVVFYEKDKKVKSVSWSHLSWSAIVQKYEVDNLVPAYWFESSEDFEVLGSFKSVSKIEFECSNTVHVAFAGSLAKLSAGSITPEDLKVTGDAYEFASDSGCHIHFAHAKDQSGRHHLVMQLIWDSRCCWPCTLTGSKHIESNIQEKDLRK